MKLIMKIQKDLVLIYWSLWTQDYKTWWTFSFLKRFLIEITDFIEKSIKTIKLTLNRFR